MDLVVKYACVGAGSALGGMARYWLGLVMTRLYGDAFPWGTLLINIIGSFVIGFYGTLTTAEGARPASVELRLFVMVGLCGGFTTFSAFSLQTVELLREGAALRGGAYVLASVGLCLIGTIAGQALATLIATRG
jgi:CrcB protein